MSTIDPTARIEDGAVIGEGTEIGPYCIIGRHVVIGANCKLIAHVHITAQTTIGDGTTIYPFAAARSNFAPPSRLSLNGVAGFPTDASLSPPAVGRTGSGA